MMHSIAPDNAGSIMLELDEQGRIFRPRNPLECITAGRLLLQIKASLPHGEFLGRVKALDLSEYAGRRYMKCARLFDPDRDTVLLAAIKSASKLFELLCLDAEEIEALRLGGQVRGLTLEGIALMTVKQLRKELQEGNANITQATQEKWDEMGEQIDKSIAEPVHSNVGASQQMIAFMKFFQHVPLNLSRLDAAELAPVAACLDADSPAVWRNLAGRLFMVLKAQPLMACMAPEALAQAAVSQTYQLVRDLGGSTLYLGVGNGLRVKALKHSIVAASDGRSVEELSKKHGVTPSRVRQILRENAQCRPSS